MAPGYARIPASGLLCGLAVLGIMSSLASARFLQAVEKAPSSPVIRVFRINPVADLDHDQLVARMEALGVVWQETAVLPGNVSNPGFDSPNVSRAWSKVVASGDLPEIIWENGGRLAQADYPKASLVSVTLPIVYITYPFPYTKYLYLYLCKNATGYATARRIMQEFIDPKQAQAQQQALWPAPILPDLASQTQLRDLFVKAAVSTVTGDVAGLVRLSSSQSEYQKLTPQAQFQQPATGQPQPATGAPVNGCPVPSGYLFYPGLDATGNDIIAPCQTIGSQTVEDLASQCTADRSCLAFNRYQEKASVGLQSCSKSATSLFEYKPQFTNFTLGPCLGLYIKKKGCPVPNGYVFYPRQDSAGNDITAPCPRVGSQTVQDLAKACSADKTCQAFNKYLETVGAEVQSCKKKALAKNFNPAEFPGDQALCLGLYVKDVADATPLSVWGNSKFAVVSGFVRTGSETSIVVLKATSFWTRDEATNGTAPAPWKLLTMSTDPFTSLYDRPAKLAAWLAKNLAPDSEAADNRRPRRDPKSDPNDRFADWVWDEPASAQMVEFNYGFDSRLVLLEPEQHRMNGHQIFIPNTPSTLRVWTLYRDGSIVIGDSSDVQPW